MTPRSIPSVTAFNVFRCLALFHTLVLGSSAQAIGIFSNLGPGDSFSTASHTVSNSGSILGVYQGAGMQFVAGASDNLSALELGFVHQFGANSYKFTLATNVAGQPGAALETWASAAPSTPSSLLTLTSVTNVGLISGKTYWVTAQPVANTAWGGWYQNNLAQTSHAFSQASLSGSWSLLSGAPDGALRVSGATAAPEPATLALVLASVAVGALVLRRKFR